MSNGLPSSADDLPRHHLVANSAPAADEPAEFAEKASSGSRSLPPARPTAKSVLTEAKIAEADAKPAATRGRGRPPLGNRAMSKAERNAGWRARRSIVAIEIPADLADRIRRVRNARSVKTAELLAAALDALEYGTTVVAPASDASRLSA